MKLRVAATKVTGVARYREILGMSDAGASPTVDFVDVGSPSTLVSPEEYRVALEHMLSGLAAGSADVVVVECGSSLLEAYNVDVASAALAPTYPVHRCSARPTPRGRRRRHGVGRRARPRRGQGDEHRCGHLALPASARPASYMNPIEPARTERSTRFSRRSSACSGWGAGDGIRLPELVELLDEYRLRGDCRAWQYGRPSVRARFRR